MFHHYNDGKFVLEKKGNNGILIAAVRLFSL